MKIVVVTPAAMDPRLAKLVRESVAGILKSMEENGPKVERQYREGTLAPSTGFDWYLDPVPRSGDL